jgi:hypothetical protein
MNFNHLYVSSSEPVFFYMGSFFRDIYIVYNEELLSY